MPHYLLSVHIVEGVAESMSEEERLVSSQMLAVVEEDMKATDSLVLSGRLEGSEATKVVRAESGHTMMTDGPFAETKEQLGGFYVVEAADIDAAVNWASRTSAAIRMPIEVRPFWGLSRG